MSDNAHPTIPAGEFDDRRRRLRERMAAENLDVFIAYSDDRATYGQQHARYLFNYQPHFEPALTVVPLDGDAFIATGPESEALVKATSHCRDVRVVDAFTHPDEEYPFSQIHGLADALTSLSARGRAPRRIAIAGDDALPKKLWDALATATDAEFVAGDRLILGLRAIKSPSEIAVIREAYRIAEAGTAAALAATAPGVTEREIAAEAEHVMRRMGSEGMGIDTIVGSGKENTFSIICRTTNRRIGKGDHVLITLAPRYEGYHAAIGRVAAVGQVDERIERAVDVAIKPRRRPRRHCGRASRAPKSTPFRGACAAQRASSDTSPIPASTASGSSSSRRRSLPRSPPSHCRRTWCSRSTFRCSSRRGAGSGSKTASSSPRPARSRFSRSPREFAA